MHYIVYRLQRDEVKHEVQKIEKPRANVAPCGNTRPVTANLSIDQTATRAIELLRWWGVRWLGGVAWRRGCRCGRGRWRSGLLLFGAAGQGHRPHQQHQCDCVSHCLGLLKQIGQTHHPQSGWSIKYHVAIAQRLVASARPGRPCPCFLFAMSLSILAGMANHAPKLCQTVTKHAFYGKNRTDEPPYSLSNWSMTRSISPGSETPNVCLSSPLRSYSL
jgi:hypothetical protein